MFKAFYSDPHFGHANIIDYAGRPYSNLDEMHADMIQKYNAMIGEGDIVLWCGDVAMGPRGYNAVEALNGRKVLVKGNHDGTDSRIMRYGLFELVTNELCMRMCDRLVRVSHYPYRGATPDERYHERRPERKPGEVLIHGHTHSHKQRIGNMIHVGVDAWDMGPAPYSAVETLIASIFTHTLD